MLPIVAVPVPDDSDHVPVAGVLFRVVVWPTHTEATPPIVAGSAFTVIGEETSEQPVDNVYVTVHVPALIPV